MVIPNSKTLIEKNVDGVLYYAFPSIEKIPFVAHGVSTRIGGVSDGIFESMNLSFDRGDDKDKVYENFCLFSKAVGVDADRIVMSRQTHSINVRVVTDEDIGSGIIKERSYDEVDALVTNKPNVPLCTLYADCVPLFFADPEKKVIATAHSGWCGTVHEIGKETIRVMSEKFGCNPKDICVGIGPSIGYCCFEIDEPVYKEFEKLPFFDEKCGHPDGNGKYHVNLWEVNRQILLRAGILEENLSVTDLCTRCYPDIFWSHRYTGPQRGSLAGMIMIKE